MDAILVAGMIVLGAAGYLLCRALDRYRRRGGFLRP